MKKLIASALAALMLLPLVACGQQETGDIVIGGLAPLTGGVSYYGNGVRNAALIAVDEINAAGGILGRQIKYVCYDEQGDPTEAINAYNKLVQTDKMVALMGDVTTKPTLAVAGKAADDNMPMVTPTASGDTVTEAGTNIFRVCFTDSYQGTLMADYAVNALEAGSVAGLYDTGDDYTAGLAEAFTAKAGDLGIEVTASEGYPTGSTDFNSQLTRIKSTNPDVIFVACYYEDAALIITQAREMGIDQPLLGPDGWDGVLEFMEGQNTEALNNCFYSSQYSTANPSPALQTFMDEYRSRYNEDENMFAVLGYEAIYALADAITAAGNTKSEDIIKALSSLEFEGLTGTISFKNGQDASRDAFIVEFVDGEAVDLGAYSATN